MAQSPNDIYAQRLKDGSLKLDPVQAKAVLPLQRLYNDLIRKKSPRFAFWCKRPETRQASISMAASGAENPC